MFIQMDVELHQYVCLQHFIYEGWETRGVFFLFFETIKSPRAVLDYKSHGMKTTLQSPVGKCIHCFALSSPSKSTISPRHYMHLQNNPPHHLYLHLNTKSSKPVVMKTIWIKSVSVKLRASCDFCKCLWWTVFLTHLKKCFNKHRLKFLFSIFFN